MKFPPTCSESGPIKERLYDLDTLRAGFALHALPSETTLHLRRKSVLKSSLYSARIEGNRLEESDLTHGLSEESREKKEIANLSRAYDRLFKESAQTMSLTFLKELHRHVMDGLSGEAGLIRIEESAIYPVTQRLIHEDASFGEHKVQIQRSPDRDIVGNGVYNQAGIAVYLTPAPGTVPSLLEEWCTYVNMATNGPVEAAVAHIWFEKIHPFLDGNGRVGRLSAAWILAKTGYDFSGLVPFEEYLDNHRDAYYDALSPDRSDVTAFVEFFLDALYEQAKTSLKEAVATPRPLYPNLLPRRAEIVSIIKDHGMVSFDFLRRRFRAVPERTLHYDLSQLCKNGYVKKLGSTRGSVYTLSL